MGDGADDLREREEDMEMQRTLHERGQCDGLYGFCPVCVGEEFYMSEPD